MLNTEPFPISEIAARFLPRKRKQGKVLVRHVGAAEGFGNMAWYDDSSGNSQYPIFDPAGNTQQARNASNQVTQDQLLNAFGQLESVNVGNTDPTMTFLSQQGGWRDPNTGLIYLRARWYDPSIKRFISKDPLGPLNDPNPYRYAGNNPVSNTDASGMQDGPSGFSVPLFSLTSYRSPMIGLDGFHRRHNPPSSSQNVGTISAPGSINFGAVSATPVEPRWYPLGNPAIEQARAALYHRLKLTTNMWAPTPDQALAQYFGDIYEGTLGAEGQTKREITNIQNEGTLGSIWSDVWSGFTSHEARLKTAQTQLHKLVHTQATILHAFRALHLGNVRFEQWKQKVSGNYLVNYPVYVHGLQAAIRSDPGNDLPSGGIYSTGDVVFVGTLFASPLEAALKSSISEVGSELGSSAAIRGSVVPKLYYYGPEEYVENKEAEGMFYGGPGAQGRFWATTNADAGPLSLSTGGAVGKDMSARLVLTEQDAARFQRAWGLKFSWDSTSWWKGAFGQYYYRPVTTWTSRAIELSGFGVNTSGPVYVAGRTIYYWEKASHNVITKRKPKTPLNIQSSP